MFQLQAKRLALLLVASMVLVQLAAGQRGEGEDDFDDTGFDDSGYNAPQAREAEESNQNPSNYSPSSSTEEDLDDDDDDVDETNIKPQVATDYQPAGPASSGRGGHYSNREPQRFYAPANSVLLPNVQPDSYDPNGRYRRSTIQSDENDVEDNSSESSRPALIRRKRYAKNYLGPVYTYVKTDKHAHYKWGVKHKVGKHLG